MMMFRLCLMMFSMAVMAHAKAIDMPKPVTFEFHIDNPEDLSRYSQRDIISIGIGTTLLVLDRLPAHFRYEFKYMNTRRSMVYMRQDHNICALNRLKTTQRLNEFLFSKGVNIYLSRRLYLNKEEGPLPAPLFDAAGNLDLQKLMGLEADRSIILTNNISYGDKLDAIIATLPDSRKLIRGGAGHDEGVLNIFLHRRANYYLGYPQQLMGIDMLGQELISYPIAGIPPYVVGHFMCTNNDTMRQVVNTLDQILLALYPTPPFLQAHTNYLETSAQENFNRYYNNLFIKNGGVLVPEP